ncbi:MAG: hypothetical protein HYV07_06940 [Deltaproteobacteria bacterium]|nr:hypothetical protein [Deltaproteobacteria bacterium]
MTAARKLRTKSARASAAVLLAGLDAAARVRVEARLPEVGLFEKDIRAGTQVLGWQGSRRSRSSSPPKAT